MRNKNPIDTITFNALVTSIGMQILAVARIDGRTSLIRTGITNFQQMYFSCQASSQIVQIGRWFCDDPAFQMTQQKGITSNVQETTFSIIAYSNYSSLECCQQIFLMIRSPQTTCNSGIISPSRQPLPFETKVSIFGVSISSTAEVIVLTQTPFWLVAFTQYGRLFGITISRLN